MCATGSTRRCGLARLPVRLGPPLGVWSGDSPIPVVEVDGIFPTEHGSHFRTARCARAREGAGGAAIHRFIASPGDPWVRLWPTEWRSSDGGRDTGPEVRSHRRRSERLQRPHEWQNELRQSHGLQRYNELRRSQWWHWHRRSFGLRRSHGRRRYWPDSASQSSELAEHRYLQSVSNGSGEYSGPARRMRQISGWMCSRPIVARSISPVATRLVDIARNCSSSPTINQNRTDLVDTAPKLGKSTSQINDCPNQPVTLRQVTFATSGHQSHVMEMRAAHTPRNPASHNTKLRLPVGMPIDMVNELSPTLCDDLCATNWQMLSARPCRFIIHSMRDHI